MSSPKGCQMHVRSDSETSPSSSLPGGLELLRGADRTAHGLCCTSYRGDRIPSRPEGFAVAMALATPKLPSYGNRRGPLEGADDGGHRIWSRSV